MGVVSIISSNFVISQTVLMNVLQRMHERVCNMKKRFDDKKGAITRQSFT